MGAMAQITRTSQFTGITRTLELPITEQQYIRWKAGENIQDAMPHLTPAQREFLMTGATDEEWNEAFPPDEEE